MKFDLRVLLPLVMPFVLFWFLSLFIAFAGLPMREELRGSLAFSSLFVGMPMGLFAYFEGRPDHWAIIDLRDVWNWVMGGEK